MVKHPCILVPVGTRPELVKLADVLRDLSGRTNVETEVVFTGQHTELLAEAATALNIRANHQIPPLPSGRNLTDLLAVIVKELGRLADARDVACVVVQGDTVSCLAGAVVSELQGIPLVHVEAGVRSRLRDDPFPEETIRRMISPITELHICFSSHARRNLLAEGIDPETIFVAPHPLGDRVARFEPSSNGKGPLRVLLTFHRRERRGARARAIAEVVSQLRKRFSVEVTFVRHPGVTSDLPWLGERFSEMGAEVLNPLPPDRFLDRLSSATLVITDSAGVAEEAQLLGVPLLVFRRSGEARIDEAPSGPTCATESADVALTFAMGVLAAPPANGRFAPSTASAGAVIGERIAEFAREQVR